MTSYIKPFNGQSNMDLCMKAYGGLDNFVAFLNDNKITNSSNVSSLNYKYDTEKIINKLYAGKDYGTNRIIIPTIPLLDNDGINLLDNDGTNLLDNIL